MATVLLTGAAGQLGFELEFALLSHNFNVLSCRHDDFDISDEERVKSAVFDTKPDLVINTAAYTNVEKAETERTAAMRVNAMGPLYLASACHLAGIPIIHISTDYVFSDDLGRPHTEDDPTHAECSYGQSKLKGEMYVRDACPRHIILRTSWLFGRFGRNFVKVMMALARDRKDIAVVGDQFGNPTPVEPLAAAIVKIAESVLKPDFNAFGTYHFCGYEAVSWAEFAERIFKTADEMGFLAHPVNVVPIRSRDFRSRVKRPKDSRLDCNRIASVFGIRLPYWSDYVEDVILSYVNDCARRSKRM